MTRHETEWTTVWEIGNCSIHQDRFHNCYDVGMNNLHYSCIPTLEDAVDKVLELQGWGKDFMKNSLRFSIVNTMYRNKSERSEKIT